MIWIRIRVGVVPAQLLANVRAIVVGRSLPLSRDGRCYVGRAVHRVRRLWALDWSDHAGDRVRVVQIKMSVTTEMRTS